MPEIDEEQGTPPLRPRGRRRAPKSAVATAFEPLAPALAAAIAWVSTHRLGAMIAVCSLATVAMLGGGIALIQSSGAGAGATPSEPDADSSYSMLDDPRPTSTTPSGPSPFGPILPTPAPPTAVPTPEPGEVVEPPIVDDEPVVEPTPTAEPGPADPPGRGNGPKKPKE